jgi:hypothetical protein
MWFPNMLFYLREEELVDQKYLEGNGASHSVLNHFIVRGQHSLLPKLQNWYSVLFYFII